MTRPVVLVVEDNPMMRQTLMRVLHEAGMHALGVDRGDRVLSTIRKYGVHIVVLDFELASDISGLDVLRGLRTRPSTRDIPVILHTSESGVTALPESDLADLILLKPADPDDLVMMTKRLLRARSLPVPIAN
ncbi:MAG: response regulator [Chloroflexota bacterium]